MQDVDNLQGNVIMNETVDNREKSAGSRDPDSPPQNFGRRSCLTEQACLPVTLRSVFE
jgi:hypothetical protein